MIDTHAHLDFENFDEDRGEALQRFFSQGGKAIINIGVDLETSKRSTALAEKHENIFAAVGFHPEYFSKDEKDLRFSIFDLRKDIEELRSLAGNKKVVAIGETGLDYFSHNNISITGEQKENQKKGFLMQIELARELDLPVVVHCRNAWSDLLEIVEQNSKLKTGNIRFALHCYSGNRDDTEKFLKFQNVYFSFSGNISYPKPIERADNFVEVIKMIPSERLMLDSDSPFLAPQTKRGKRNEPAYVRYIAERIAEIKEISVEEVEKETDANARSFFSLE